MAASETRRSKRRSALPREGKDLLEGLAIRFALTAVTHSSRNDPTNYLVSLSSVGVDHSERDAIGNSEGDDAPFPVVLTVVCALQRRAFKDERGEYEVEATVAEISLALCRIPREAH